MTYLKVTPHDPIVARDGRPFGAGSGSRMKGLGWPTPSVMAGSLRTMLGKEEPDGFINSVVTKLKSMEVAGPLPLWNGDLFFPAPKDFALRPCNAASGTPRACFRLRPRSLAEGEYCDLPGEVRGPCCCPMRPGKSLSPNRRRRFGPAGRWPHGWGRASFRLPRNRGNASRPAVFRTPRRRTSARTCRLRRNAARRPSTCCFRRSH